MMSYDIRFVENIADIGQLQWDALASNHGPFLRYAFLHALENSESCTADTGWQPLHVVVRDGHDIIALIPGYVKTHSYGEYVFDQGWANAYHQHGMEYYPKWVSAIPFTPVTGSRVLVKQGVAVSSQLIHQVIDTLKGYHHECLSSVHWLFPNDACTPLLDNGQQLLTRYSVQFQWHNYDYENFDAFLSALTARKRKEIRKTQKRHQQSGITFTHATGTEISSVILDCFIACYQATYLKRSGHLGYLNKAFFYALFNSMADNMLIVTALSHERPIASALFFYDETGLYGRYWGALEDVDGLHFATCYFEGIAFAINRKLPLFNPGTQGEHKILRGFEPIYCQSAHQLFHPAFHDAVAQFLRQETPQIIDYFNQAKNVLPFNSHFAPKLKTTMVSSPSTTVEADTHNNNEKIK